jgi:hypothetical protein
MGDCAVSQQILDETIAATSGRVIAYQKANIVPGIVPGTFLLVVSGEARCWNMKVSLTPLIYVTCPDYWGIEVVGTLPGGFCLDAIKPYVLTILLSGITGSKGIEVIGANKRESFDVSGGCSGGSEA